MANKLPNEDALLQQLNTEKVIIPSDTWNLIYSNVEDGLSIIRLLITFYLDQNQTIPVDEIKKIVTHIGDISSVFRKLINPQIIKTEDKGFIKIREENKSLHPIIRNMFSHYICNDVQSVNFILGDHLDENRPLDAAAGRLVLERVQSMQAFLVKLKMNTETFEERIRNQITLPLVYLNNIRDNLSPEDRAKIDRCIAALEEIHSMLQKKQSLPNTPIVDKTK